MKNLTINLYKHKLSDNYDCYCWAFDVTGNFEDDLQALFHITEKATSPFRKEENIDVDECKRLLITLYSDVDTTKQKLPFDVISVSTDNLLVPYKKNAFDKNYTKMPPFSWHNIYRKEQDRRIAQTEETQ